MAANFGKSPVFLSSLRNQKSVRFRRTKSKVSTSNRKLVNPFWLPYRRSRFFLVLASRNQKSVWVLCKLWESQRVNPSLKFLQRWKPVKDFVVLLLPKYKLVLPLGLVPKSIVSILEWHFGGKPVNHPGLLRKVGKTLCRPKVGKVCRPIAIVSRLSKPTIEVSCYDLLSW